MMKTFFSLSILALSAGAAFAQGAVLQGGPSTAGRAPMYSSTGQGGQTVAQDSGPAGGGAIGLGLKELLGVKRGTGTPPFQGQGTGPFGMSYCFYDAPITNPAGYHYLCLDPNSSLGGTTIAVGSGGGATPVALYFSVNGTTYTFPFSTSGVVGPPSTTVGTRVIWNNTTGTLVAQQNGAPTIYVSCAGVDDGVALGAARAALISAGSGTMVLPATTCITSSDTNVSFSGAGNYAIEGQGWASILKAKNGALLTNIIAAQNNTSFQARNLAVDCNLANGGMVGGGGTGGVILDTSNATLQGSEVHNCVNGVVLASGSSSAVKFLIQNSWIHDNQSSGITNAGVPLPNDVTITGSRFERNYNTTAITDSNGINLNANVVKVTGNTFFNNYNINGGQLAVGGGDGTTPVKSVVADNIVEQTGTVLGENTAGIEINGSAVNVIGNVVIGAKSTGIRVECGSTNVLVDGNVITTSADGIGVIQGCGANVTKATISNNQIRQALVGIGVQEPTTSGNYIYVKNNYIDPSVTTPISNPENIQALEGNSRGDWQSYTPTISSASGAPGSFSITSARYVKGSSIGKLAVRLTINTVAPATGFISVTLPWTPAGPCTFAGIDVSTQRTATGWVGPAGGALAMYRYDSLIPVANGSDLILSGDCQLN